MGTNTITNTELSFPWERYLQQKNFERHLQPKSRPIETGVEVVCDLCKKLFEPQIKRPHLQSQDCIRKKTYCEVCKINLSEISKLNNTNKSPKSLKNN